MTIWP